MAVTTFNLGDITIHRVVEQEGPFFDPLGFFPGLTAETLEATLDSMQVVEEMRRALRDIRDMNMLKPSS